MSDPSLAPAGWYTDPYAPSQLRWWDGASWSGHVAVADAAAVPAAHAGALVATADPPAPPAYDYGWPGAGGWPATAQPAPGDGSERARAGIVGVPRGTWGWGDVGWTLLATALLAILPAVGLGVVVALSGASEFDFGTPLLAWSVVVLQLVMWLGMAGWPMWAARRKGPGWWRAYGVVVSGRALGLGLGGGLVALIGMISIDTLVSALSGTEFDSAAAEQVEAMVAVTGAFYALLVLIALGAPFVEEIAFRGLLWGAVVKRGASPWLATVIAAAPFALIHFEPMRLPSLFYAGVLLGIIRHFGGLGSAMLAHATVNTIGAITLALTT